MNYLKQTLKLNNGCEIPVVGAGFWQVSRSVASQVTSDAFELGYVHIDTAVAYGNEQEIGAAISASSLDRNSMFITSKIPAEIKSYSGAKNAIENSLKKLNLDYLDLMLIHAPRPWVLMGAPFLSFKKANIKVYQALEEANTAGKIKSIGVSNFSIKDLKNIKKNCAIPVTVNQIRIHIGHVPMDVINYCKENDIIVEAYSPLGTGKLIKDERVIDVANRYHVTVAQLCIKFIIQLGLVVLPKTTHKEYLESNAKLDFEISDDDMNYLINLPGIR